MEILAQLQGLSFAVNDLITAIHAQGWELKKVSFDKSSNRWVAKAKATHGEELENWGPTEQLAISSLLANITHRNGLRSSKLSTWTHTFTSEMKVIAEAYSKAPLYEPKAASAFIELARDAQGRARSLGEFLDVTVVNHPEPYPHAEKMCEDIRKRRQLQVSSAGSEHPLWSKEQVIDFRIAFDVLGYCASGGDWGWEGTNRAFAAYAALIPAEAQKALFTEVIASTAYASYYRAYGPQKVALFPKFMDRVQRQENPHDGYRGIHPSQIFPPGEVPEAKPIVSKTAATQPYPVDEYGSPRVDINAGYSTPYRDNPLFHYDLEHQDTMGVRDVQNLANDLHTGWADQFTGTGHQVLEEWQRYKQEDQVGADRIYEAVSNAIRAACLSPRTQLHHNAIQYQDLAGISPRETDPNVYWERLENRRQEWNMNRGAKEDEHRPWMFKPSRKKDQPQELAPFARLVRVLMERDPTLGRLNAEHEAQRWIWQWKANFQEKLSNDNKMLKNKPEDQAMWIVDNESNKMVLRMIDTITKGSSPDHDIYQPSLDHTAAIEHDDALNAHKFDDSYAQFQNHKVFNLQRYGAFMGTQIQMICQLTKHLDEIVEAALWDVHIHNGAGNHFRSIISSFNIRGIGPKQISFMWLLLQPLTSQLATIDTHMARLLGDSEDDLKTPRDYFRMERELMARRDAMGLGHVPLGQFQWATWDLQRTGQDRGENDLALFPDERDPLPLHQDHSALRVLKPTAPHQVKWLPPPPKQRNYKFDFMQATDPAAEDEVSRWNTDPMIKSTDPQGVPTQANWPRLAKIASSGSVPFFVHPETGEKIHGQPGQTLMQHLQQSGFKLEDALRFPDHMVGKVDGTPEMSYHV